MTTAPRFLNRELSWLAFNRRVLEQARDPRLPPLERLRFLAITASNLDEFFMVRVGGLETLRSEGDTSTDFSGMRPSEQLSAIRRVVTELIREQYECFSKEIEPALESAGIRRLSMAELNSDQLAFVERIFEHELFPVLTPMALNLDEPFPILSGLHLHLCVRLKAIKGTESPRWAVVPLPRGVGRFITLPSVGGYQYLLVEDLIASFIDRLFPGEPVVEVVAFRITRNADLSVREDAADDLLSRMKEVLSERRQSTCVRLEVSALVTPVTREFLMASLSITEDETYNIPGPLALAQFSRISLLPGFEKLRLETWPPQPVARITPQESIFDSIASGDILLFHPYESFDPVQRFVEEAADDPQVLAIKQILYRTSENSPIVNALLRAAERNKNVTVVVELKARFDEERNIEWAAALERAGAQVIYGVKGLKVHAKVCLVIRREPSGIRRYVHFGTGNYNEQTALAYSDVSFLTADPDLTADASAFFNTITGYSRPIRYRKLEAAPHGLRDRLKELIANEAARAKQGQDAHIIAKVNSLSDPEIIDALYAASQAGVSINLIVRGICCLIPGIPGLSENIRVVSIVDRFLEHSRILCFHNAGDPLVFISSADWMPRNLDRRVELLIPIENSAAQRKLLDILAANLKDNVQSWELLPDGTYRRRTPDGSESAFRAQEYLYEQAKDAAKAMKRDALKELKPETPSKIESGQV